MIQIQNIDALAEQYKSAQPFQHIVLHNVIDPVILDEVVDEFPEVGKVSSVRYNAPTELKDITSGRSGIGPTTNALIDQLNTPDFCKLLNTLTGISKPLVSDHKLMGGGLHETRRGGFLKIHADFNKHYETGFDRRVNLLLYLNKGWKPEYGGNLELWNTDMTECGVSVAPSFNTIVIFNTTDFSYHGHPDPLTCPDGMSRKSIALYYYSKGRPAHELNHSPHNSIFKARPDTDHFEDHVT